MKYVMIDGKRHAWKDILRERREQRKAQRQHQPALFELREDYRPPAERSAEDRLLQPSLLEWGK